MPAVLPLLDASLTATMLKLTANRIRATSKASHLTIFTRVHSFGQYPLGQQMFCGFRAQIVTAEIRRCTREAQAGQMLDSKFTETGPKRLVRTEIYVTNRNHQHDQRHAS